MPSASRPGILLVAATEAELCGHDGLRCGVGPVEAAASVAAALAAASPSAVLHVGIAGARRDAGLPVGAIVVGRRAVYEDFGVTGLNTPRALDTDPGIVDATVRALGAVSLVIGTTARVGGSSECPVEAMEGFAVLRACALAGVPGVEVRAISNQVEDQRADWRVADALAALDAAIPLALDAIAELL